MSGWKYLLVEHCSSFEEFQRKMKSFENVWFIFNEKGHSEDRLATLPTNILTMPMYVMLPNSYICPSQLNVQPERMLVPAGI